MILIQIVLFLLLAGITLFLWMLPIVLAFKFSIFYILLLIPIGYVLKIVWNLFYKLCN
jgi:hypothetical protein